MISSFNLIFACLPTIVYAVTEQNLSGVTLMANPEIYQEVSGMNRKRMRQSFGLWVLSGLWHSLVVFYVPMLILFDQAGNSRGQPADLYACASTTVLVQSILPAASSAFPSPSLALPHPLPLLAASLERIASDGTAWAEGHLRASGTIEAH